MATDNLFPNGDAAANWDSSTGATHWDEVNEPIASADDATWIQTNTEGDVDTFDLTPTVVTDDATVTQVDVSFRYLSSGAAAGNNIDVDFLIGGSPQGSTVRTLLTNDAAWHDVTVNDTGWNSDWTEAQLNGAQVSFTSIQTGMPAALDFFISAVEVIITFTPGVTQFNTSGDLFIKGIDSFQASGDLFIQGVETAETRYISTTDINFGTASLFEAGSPTDISISVINSTQFAVSYIDLGDSSNGKSKVGSISGTDINFGTESEFLSSGAADYVTSTPLINNSGFIVTYSDSADSNHGTAKVGIVNGTDITFGTETEFHSSGTAVWISLAMLLDDKFIVCYRDQTDANKGKARIGTLSGPSGTNITFGPTYEFSIGITTYTQVTALTDSTFVVAHKNVSANSGIANVGTIDGTTITFGNGEVFGAATDDLSIDRISNTEFAVMYHSSGTTRIGTVNGTNITFGNEFPINSSGDIGLNDLIVLSSNHLVGSYVDEADSNHGTSKIGLINGTNINFLSEFEFLSTTADWISAGKIHPYRFVVAFKDGTDGKARVADLPVDGDLFIEGIGGIQTSGDLFIQGTLTAATRYISTADISFGNPSTFLSSGTSIENRAAVMHSTQFVVAYKDNADSDHGTAKVGSLSGTDITFGAESEFVSSGAANFINVDRIDDSRFVVAYQDAADAVHGTAKIGTVSGTNIIFGEEAEFNSASTTNVGMSTTLLDDQFVVVYRDNYGSKGKAQIGTISGTDITFGSQYEFMSSGAANLNTIAALSDSQFVVAYQDAIESSRGVVVIGTISGATITFGAKTLFSPASASNISVDRISDTEFAVTYHVNGITRIGTVSGTDITLGDEFQANTAGNIGRSEFIVLSPKHLVGSYPDVADASHGTSKIGVITGTNIEFGSEFEFLPSNAADYIGADSFNQYRFVVVFGDATATDSGVARIGDILVDGNLFISGPSGATASGNLFISGSVAVDSISDSRDLFIHGLDNISTSGDLFIEGHTTAATRYIDTSSDINFGTAFEFNSSGNTVYNNIAVMSPTQCVVAYRDLADSNHGTAKVASVVGTDITFGDEFEFNSSGTTNYVSVAPIGNSKFVVAYQDNPDSDHGTARIGTVSGTSITFGPEYEFLSSGAASYISVTSPSGDSFVVSYRDGGDSNKGKVKVGTVDGTTITFGLDYLFNTSSAFFNDIVAIHESGFSIAYQDGEFSNDGSAKIGIISGTVVSFGAREAFTVGEGIGNISVGKISDTEFAVLYQVNGTVLIGTVNGTDISFGNKFLNSTSGDIGTNAVPVLSQNRLATIYGDLADANHGTAKIGIINGTDISIGAEHEFNNGNGASWIHAEALDASKFIIAFGDDVTSRGTAIVGAPIVDGDLFIKGREVAQTSGDLFTHGLKFISSNDTDVCFFDESEFLTTGRALRQFVERLDDNRFVVMYGDGSDSNHGTAKIGVVSGTDISFGEETEFHASGTEGTFRHNASRVDTDKFVITYTSGAAIPGRKGLAKVGIASGTDITFGGQSIFGSGDTRDTGLATLDTNKVVVIHRDDDTTMGQASIGTVSGTDIVFGPQYVFNASGDTANLYVDALSETQFIVVFKDNDDSGHGTAQIGTVSGTTITFGAEFDFLTTTGGCNPSHVVALNSSTFVVSYVELDGPPFDTELKVGSIDGATITFGSVVSSDTSSFHSLSRFSDTEFIFVYKDSDNSNGVAKLGTVNGTTIQFGNTEAYVTGTGPGDHSAVTLDYEKFVVVYEHNDDSDHAKARIGEVQGLSGDDLFIQGHESVNTSGDLFVSGIGFIQASGDLFIQASVAVSTSGDLFVQGHGIAATRYISTTSDINFGIPSIFGTDSVFYTDIAKMNPTQAVVVYMDGGDSFHGTARVASINGTDIVFGDESEFLSSGSAFYNSAAPIGNSKFVVAYQDATDSNHGTARIGTVSGTSITFGPEFEFNSSGTTSHISVSKLADDKFVVCYQDESDGDNGTAKIGTVTGTDIAFGLEYEYNTGTSAFNSSIALHESGFVVAYQFGDQSFNGYANVGTVDGTVITFGDNHQFTTETATQISVDRISDTEFAIIHSVNGTTRIGTVSGTDITFGNEFQFNSSGNNGNNDLIALSQNQLVALYDDNADSSHGTSKIGVVDGTNLVFGSEFEFLSANAVGWITANELNPSKFIVAFADQPGTTSGVAIVGETLVDGNLFIEGSDTTSTSGDLFVEGHQNISTSGDLFISGAIDITSHTASGDLFIQGHQFIDTSGDLFIKGIASISTSGNLFIKGHEAINTSGDLFIQGLDIISTSGDLFIKGLDTISTSGDLFITSRDTITVSGDLFINGFVEESGVTPPPLFIEGHETISLSGDLFVKGLDNVFTSGDLFIQGLDNIFTSGDLFIQGLDTASTSGDLFIAGQDSVDTSGDLFIKGPDFISISGDLFIQGKDSVTTSGDLFIEGHEIFQASGDLFISGAIDVFPAASSLTLFIAGPILVTTSGDLFIHGLDTVQTSGDLFISGQDSVSTSGDLFINGLVEESGVTPPTLFILGHDTSSTSGDLFIEGSDSASTSGDLFINGKETISTSGDLFIGGVDDISTSGDLFIEGHETFQASGDLFISGAIDVFAITLSGTLFIAGPTLTTTSGDLFIHGLDTVQTSGDLFISGRDTATTSGDLFVHGLDVISTSGDLFINGLVEESGVLPPPLFILGHDISSTSGDLFIEGHNTIQVSGDLFIEGQDTITTSGDLFIRGLDTIQTSGDLFVGGQDSITTSGDLFIPGLDVNSASGDLFISGAAVVNIFSTSGDLFISGAIVVDSITISGDLFISGQDSATTSGDLFIEGHIAFDGSGDLFTIGLGAIQTSGDLYMAGPILSSGQANLFIEGLSGFISVSGSTPLFVNGFEPKPGVVCPTLDPTATIQIKAELIAIYQNRIDALINQLGKNVLLQFDPIREDCPNCTFDRHRNRSTGIYTIGGPRPFKRGRKCPYCKGRGLLETPVTKCIKCLVKWSPRELKDYGISVENRKGIVRLKTYLTEMDDIIRAKTSIVDYDQRSVTNLRVRKIRGPVPVGLRQDRYCISYWELL
jgi:hypothetical protein